MPPGTTSRRQASSPLMASAARQSSPPRCLRSAGAFTTVRACRQSPWRTAAGVARAAATGRPRSSAET
eukprot:scaffold538675_cov43-Prasinocladus_malaysianus.AAC.1